MSTCSKKPCSFPDQCAGRTLQHHLKKEARIGSQWNIVQPTDLHATLLQHTSLSDTLRLPLKLLSQTIVKKLAQW